MSVFNTRGLVYASNCTIAAMLALYIAFSAGLPNPWWAALTVFITSQPMAAASGAVVSRALYRLGGTVVGVAASMVILPALVQAPELMIAAVAAWLALCIYISLLDRSPRGYAFLLAGYTVALVGLPLVGDTSQLFDSAVSRIEEIAVGALSAALVHSLVLPRSLKSQMEAKLNASLKDARTCILAALLPETAAAAEQAVRKRMAADLTELHLLTIGHRFDMGAGAADKRTVSALEERLVALLPLLTGVEDRLGAMTKESAMPQALSLHVAEIRGWIEEATTSDRERVDRLLESGRRALPAPGTSPQWIELLATSLVHRLAELAEAWNDCLHLAQLVRDPRLPRDARAHPLVDGQRRRPLHVDHGLAAFAGLGAGVAVLLTGALAMATGWQQGTVAVGIAAAGSAVFAFIDDPRPMQKLLVLWTLIAAPVAGLYLFAILPAVDGFGMLMLAMFPLFFGTALYLGTPRYWLQALGFALVSQTLISLQPAHRADFETFMTGAVAALAGGIVALTVTSLMRVVSAETSSWRVLRAGWRDLAALADGRRSEGRSAWASRMLDRVGLLIPRLARAAGADRLRYADPLNELRLGVNVADLREVARESGGAVAPSIDAALRRFADHFRIQTRDGHVPPGSDLLNSIDKAIHQLLGSSTGDLRLRGLAAATGLRRGLFPDAPPYRHEECVTC
jgi:uncharacterized membrane protein YccC